MFTRATRTITALAGAATAGLLTLAPAGATAAPPPSPVAVPTLCIAAWSNVILGTPGDDELIGTQGNDLIIGLGGNDTLVGGLGRDILLGGVGNDTLYGDQGNDCIFGGPGADESVLYWSTQPNGTDTNNSVAFRYEY